MYDYFLHKECGYTYTDSGRLGELTRPEEEDLFRGYYLWKKHVEGDGEAASSSGSSKADQERRFDAFADEVNDDG
ncbi:hypothetical protein [Natronococcus roseus]|uniref:hypothetical protein n=1 Tax=Natronococcus roseus TaxID=1052014 RepID=UPI00374DECA5